MKGLGRGLDALLGGGDDFLQPSSEIGLQVMHVSLSDLQPGETQPRKHLEMGALQGLADSIRIQGMLQPILVRETTTATANDTAAQYEIVAGERRWRAARIAGLSTVPVIVKKISTEEALVIGLIENIQREELSPLEEAQAIERLLNEFEMTHQQISETLGRSRSAVTNLLRLLKLCPEVQQMLNSGALSAGHARTLVPLPSDIQQQVAEVVLNESLSVRELEKHVSMLLEAQKDTDKEDNKEEEGVALPRTGPKPATYQHHRYWQSRLSAKLAAKVKIKRTANGQEMLSIQFSDSSKLEMLLAYLDCLEEDISFEDSLSPG